MPHEPLRIRTGLSVFAAGAILIAVIDEPARAVRIEQRGDSDRGDVITVARKLLVERVRRVRPDLEVMG